MDAKTGAFKGAPGKAGAGNAKLSAKCTLNLEGSNGKIKATVVKTLPWSVAALDEWAQGKFVGENFQMKVSKNGKMSCKVVLGGRKLSFSAKCYAECENGCYRVGGGVRGGGTFSIVVTERDGAQLALTTADGAVSRFSGNAQAVSTGRK